MNNQLLNFSIKWLYRIERAAKRRKESLLIKKRVKVDYNPRPDDVFMVSYPKSGTTWMQNILYLLLHEGRLDFEHISEVSPFFDTTFQAPSFDRIASPRVIKSHMLYSAIPSADVKYVYIIRNIEDVLVSYYHHYCSFQGFRGNLMQFLAMYESNNVYGGYWGLHVAGWLQNQNKKQIHFVRYENLLADFDHELQKLAHFLDVQLTDVLIEDIKRQSSFDFMKANFEKFDYYYELAKRRMPAPPGQHIRQGKSGQGEDVKASPTYKHVLREKDVVSSLIEEIAPVVSHS